MGQTSSAATPMDRTTSTGGSTRAALFQKKMIPRGRSKGIREDRRHCAVLGGRTRKHVRKSNEERGKSRREDEGKWDGRTREQQVTSGQESGRWGTSGQKNKMTINKKTSCEQTKGLGDKGWGDEKMRRWGTREDQTRRRVEEGQPDEEARDKDTRGQR